jgi:hypothetical protein
MNCQGNIAEELTLEPKRVFHAYLEDWEECQLVARGVMFMPLGCQQSMRGWGFMTKIMIALAILCD